MQNTLFIYHDLIEGIVAALDARDPYTAKHSQRVSEIAKRICGWMKRSKAETELIHIAADVHDIGKLGIPDYVLSKSSALTEVEWELMKNHAEIGYQILIKVSGFEEVANIVRHHHERWDGRGYPMRLAAEQIPFGSRVIAVADSIDAMLSQRVYRDAMSSAQCRFEIERNSGAMYDPSVADVILKNWYIISDFYHNEVRTCG